MEEETEKISLKKEDALRRDKWRDGVRAIAEGMGQIRPSLLSGQHRIKSEQLTTTTTTGFASLFLRLLLC